MDQSVAPEASVGLLIIRVWREPEQRALRLRVVAKVDVTADAEERHAFGSIDDAMGFARAWLEGVAWRPDHPARRSRGP
jgi:hypothetical protein